MPLAESVSVPADSKYGTGHVTLSLDKIRRAASEVHKWSIEGTDDSDVDQADFYFLRTAATEAGSDLATLTPPPGWSEVEMARYLADNEAALVNMHFTRASSDDLLDGLTIRFIRETPARSKQEETFEATQLIHDARVDKRVLSVGIKGEVLDGYTNVQVNTPGPGGGGEGSAESYTLTFKFAAANDKRADAPPGQAEVVVGAATAARRS